MKAALPILVSLSPTGTGASSTPEIVLVWSTDMNSAEFTDSAALNSNVHLYKESDGTKLELTYVSENVDTHSYTLAPVSVLDSSTVYRVVVHSGILDVFGRSHATTRTFFFTTVASELSAPSNLLPDNFVTTIDVPTFQWASSGGQYRFLIDDEYDFSSPLLDEIVGAVPYTPSVVLTEGTTYYWKAQEVSGDQSGDWSEVRSFYYGGGVQASPTNQWVESDGPLSFIAKWHRTSNKAEFPTLAVTFSAELDLDTTGDIEFVRKPVLPRNDETDDYEEVAVPGAWSYSNKVLTFIPSTTLVDNNEYTMRLPDTLTSVSGRTLEESQELYFVSKLTPYYCGRFLVEAMLGREAKMISPALIDFNIHLNSLQANALYLAESVWSGSIEGISETQIRQPELKSHAVMRWVACKTVSAVVSRILYDEIRMVGRNLQLSDYQESLSADFLDALKAASQKADDEAKSWEDVLIGGPMPGAVGKNEWWSNDYYLLDLSIQGLRRGKI